MAQINEIKHGEHSNSEKYTEYSMFGEKDVIVVQSTGGYWYIYRNSPGAKGAVITLGVEDDRLYAEKFAEGYIKGMHE